jgi:hypothetical protein
MNVLDHPSRPHVIYVSCNLLVDEGGKVMCRSSGLYHLYPVLVYCGGEKPLKVSVTPEIAVTTDPVVIE